MGTRDVHSPSSPRRRRDWPSVREALIIHVFFVNDPG